MIKGDGDDAEDAQIMPFRPNRAQKRFIRRLWHRNLILKARQLGFTTLICLLWLDHALFNANQRCGHHRPGPRGRGGDLPGQGQVRLRAAAGRDPRAVSIGPGFGDRVVRPQQQLNSRCHLNALRHDPPAAHLGIREDLREISGQGRRSDDRLHSGRADEWRAGDREHGRGPRRRVLRPGAAVSGEIYVARGADRPRLPIPLLRLVARAEVPARRQRGADHARGARVFRPG